MQHGLEQCATGCAAGLATDLAVLCVPVCMHTPEFVGVLITVLKLNVK